MAGSTESEKSPRLQEPTGQELRARLGEPARPGKVTLSMVDYMRHLDVLAQCLPLAKRPAAKGTHWLL